jgi:hypothetical protein
LPSCCLSWPVPLGPTNSTFSRRSKYSPFWSSNIWGWLTLDRAANSSKSLCAGKRAALSRRSADLRSRSISRVAAGTPGDRRCPGQCGWRSPTIPRPCSSPPSCLPACRGLPSSRARLAARSSMVLRPGRPASGLHERQRSSLSSTTPRCTASQPGTAAVSPHPHCLFPIRARELPISSAAPQPLDRRLNAPG